MVSDDDLRHPGIERLGVLGDEVLGHPARLVALDGDLFRVVSTLSRKALASAAVGVEDVDALLQPADAAMERRTTTKPGNLEFKLMSSGPLEEHHTAAVPRSRGAADEASAATVYSRRRVCRRPRAGPACAFHTLDDLEDLAAAVEASDQPGPRVGP